MSISTTVPSTGEIIDLETESPEALMASYRLVNDYLDAYTKLKKELQDLAADIVDEHGTYESRGWLLRVSYPQRMNYSKASLREVFDPDELDLFLDPAKGRIDKYIKDHLADLGEQATLLRQTMVPTGNAYRQVRLERLERPS